MVSTKCIIRPEEIFKNLCREPVEYIVTDWRFDVEEDNSFHCHSIIAKFGEQRFIISSRYSGNGKYDFCFETCSSFNPNFWPYRIESEKNEPITFFKRDDSSAKGPSLIFHVGDKTVSFAAGERWLIVSQVEVK